MKWPRGNLFWGENQEWKSMPYISSCNRAMSLVVGILRSPMPKGYGDMALLCTVQEVLDSGDHEYRVLCPDTSIDWLKEAAEEYIRLRTACVTPLSALSLDGIGVVSTVNLQERLKKATIPLRRDDNFDVVRSDFGEVLTYLILERHYGVRLGYKSVRDRELTQLPGRGIDAVGIEGNSPLTLVLGETKVSDDKKSPPGVVDTSEDCLSKQHLMHLTDRDHTAAKLWDLVRRVADVELREAYIAAAILIEDGHLDKLRIVGCCTLVRPQGRYTERDFGSFKKKPKKFEPARIRFLVVRMESGIDEVVQKWYEIIKKLEPSA